MSQYFGSSADFQAYLNNLPPEKVGSFVPFDAAWYASRYMGSYQGTLTPFDHFFSIGAARGYAPSASFDPVVYVAQYSDLGGLDSVDLLAHYLTFGLDEGRLGTSAMFGFDGERYLSENPDVAAYINANLDDFGGSELNGASAHYIKFGSAEGRLAYTTAGTPISLNTFPATSAIQMVGDALWLNTNGGESMLVKGDTPIDGDDTDGILRLAGDADVRIDMTNPANQMRGIDLDGDGKIEANGVENNVSGAGIVTVRDHFIVDAYPRNPLNELDSVNNFLGDIDYSGTGFGGDGVSTDGNIVLGGLGMDDILAGIGNDFLVGGGVAGFAGAGLPTEYQGTVVGDFLSGGRNADFMYGEFASLENVDGVLTMFDGGTTADDVAPGNSGSGQDSDWLLLEIADDEEYGVVELDDTYWGDPSEGWGSYNGIVDYYGGDGFVAIGDGKRLRGILDDVENVDASGNLYGFLDGYDVELGGRRLDDRDGASEINYGLGSSGQLIIDGSDANNILIGGYDNDSIWGDYGDDLLMGGNMQFFLSTVEGGVTNPNLAGIVNDGSDELYGNDGDDNILFEADGGIIDGSSGEDTLWLTDRSLGAVDVEDVDTVTTDGVLRFELMSGDGEWVYEDYYYWQWYVDGNDWWAGTGGADVEGTADQTNYSDSGMRVDVEGMDSIIATGMGAIDYLAAGTNDPELNFRNQQNFFAYNGDLDLRGSGNDNTLYAAGGDDIIEGRWGDDRLSGGNGSDDFYFSLGSGEDSGDQVDVIHRQTDANNDNIWDGTFSRDFDIGGVTTASNSTFTLTMPANQYLDILDGINFKLGGVDYQVRGLAAETETLAQWQAKLNAALDANPALANIVVTSPSAGVIVMTDPSGRIFVENTAGGWETNTTSLPSDWATGASQQVGPPTVAGTNDRLIFKAYEDRSDDEGVDDNSFTGSIISLGEDNYAEDLVVDFASDGTRIAEDQRYHITFDNLTTQDKVKIAVNGVTYELQVGIDLDGLIIGAEDGVGDSQQEIQEAFLQRMTDFINSFMDDDTAVGAVNASFNGVDTLTLTQRDYNGEETVFMKAPVVTIQNLSGGEAAYWEIHNNANSEIHLLNYLPSSLNGQLTRSLRDNGAPAAFNADNVLFWGEEEINRAQLQTALDAGQTVTGKEAIVIDGGVNDLEATVRTTGETIADNIASNDPLDWINVAVHGDDLLIGGKGNDTINAGTGDDRVLGSLGTDALDGGKNFYAVKLLGEAQSRVYVLNVWEAANIKSAVAELASATVTSVTLIDQSETGTYTNSGLFDDTLLFQQADFSPGNSRFTITLNDFSVDSSKVVQLKNGGAGTVQTDVDGNGTFEATTTFKNFENIRTVSGVGKAVAGAGQGNDTLNVTALSTATGGILYNLTNGGEAGKVEYSTDAFVTGTKLGTAAGDRPAEGDYESLVLRVDGVENVIGGDGNDMLLIDQTEAAKDNRFEAGLGIDRVEYRNAFDSGVLAEPTATIKVNAASDTDTVTFKGGRVGTLTTASGGAVDTLVSTEFIALNGNTAQGIREDDVLDVTTMVTGAVVDYTNGEVRAVASGGIVAGTGVQVVIENIVQIENVVADGPDTVIVADADVMNNNTRSDELNGTPSTDIAFSTFFDFDTFTTTFAGTAAVPRKAFGAQSAAEITDVINQNQFTFNMGEGGTDVDTVDYSNELGRIVSVVNFNPANPARFVLVDGDSNGNLTDAQSRVDRLINAERIVASQGESVIDLTSSDRDVNVVFSYNQPTQASKFVEGEHKETAAGRQINTVRIADAKDQSALGNVDLIEYRDLDAADTITAPLATWERVEGGDKREFVQLTMWEDMINHTFNLRGGNNEVNYNERTNGIYLNISSINATVGGVPGQYSMTAAHLNSVGAQTGTLDTIYGYNPTNRVAAGTMRIEASQGDQDFLNVVLSVDGKAVYLVGQVESSGDSVVTVNVDGQEAGLTLSGFEYLWDSVGGDTYTIKDLSDFVSKLTLIDWAQTYDGAGNFTGSTDRDGVKLTNGSFETAAIRPPVSHSITVSNDLRMGDGSANDLQWLGVNNNTYRTELGDTPNTGAGGTSVGFDFQVLDISEVTNQTKIKATGSALGTADELIVGGLNYLDSTGTAIVNFDTLSLTNASAGTSFDFDLDADQLQDATNAKIVGFDADMGTFDLSRITGRDVTIRVTDVAAVGASVIGSAGNDNITGSAGADTIRGFKGNDVMEGGTAAEIREIQINPTGSLAAAPSAITITLDGYVLTLNVVAAVVDVDPALGDNLDILQGVGSIALGNALASLVNANLGDINNGVRFGGTALQGVTHDTATGLLRFTFAGGTDVLATDPIVIAGAGLGTVTVTAENVVGNGGDGGVDNFVFETAAADNGSDVINAFQNAGANPDNLIVSSFLGAAPNFGGIAIAAAGLDLSGAANVGVVYNKSSLAASDIVSAFAAGKIAVENNGKAVVLVTADADGAADGTNNPYLMYFIEDTDAGAGQTWVVTLVGTINSLAEGNAGNWDGTDFG